MGAWDFVALSVGKPPRLIDTLFLQSWGCNLCGQLESAEWLTLKQPANLLLTAEKSAEWVPGRVPVRPLRFEAYGNFHVSNLRKCPPSRFCPIHRV